MTEQEMRAKVIKGLECCAAMSGDKCRECPYSKECLDADLPYGMPHLAANALALLKAQENEIKALRLLVDCAEECDFGLDNIRWREYVTKEELDRVEDYIEKMIYVARRAVEQG